MLAGTDRCNQLELGDARFQAPATTECGGDYRTSDMAHNVDTDFQVMHDRLRDHFPGSTNVQLHGMSLPGISVSRGDDPNDGSATFPNDLVAVAHQSYSQELTTAMRANGESAEETNQIANLTSCTPYFDTIAGRQALTRDDRAVDSTPSSGANRTLAMLGIGYTSSNLFTFEQTTQTLSVPTVFWNPSTPTIKSAPGT